MTPSRFKIDLFMPLEIGRYLQDTAHLDITKSGAYLHLLMHYWTHGPLPNDPDQLAAIARMSPDAWSIAYAVLKQFFSIGPDGLLHQVGSDRRLEFWKGKKQKAHDKAQKAARARWDKEKAKRGAKDDAPSIAQALLEQCPISVSEVQEQIQPSAPTPSRGGGMGLASSTRLEQLTPRQAGTSPRQLGKSPKQTGTAPRQVGRSPRQLGRSPRQVGRSPRQASAAIQSEDKGKPTQNGSVGLPTNGVRGYRHSSPIGAVAVAHNRIAPGVNKVVRPSKTDSRKNEFKEEFLRYWQGLNPEVPKFTFGPADEQAFDDVLDRYPELTVAEFRLLLLNRSRSGVNSAALPYRWLRKILEYAAGPLGPSSRPAARSRSM